MERLVGTVSRGMRAPIIREGDDLEQIVTDVILEGEKAGEYREGDFEYLNELLEKKAKLTLDDINTELTYENIDTALGK